MINLKINQKYFIVIVLLIMISSSSIAQNLQRKSDSVVVLLKKYINTKNTDAIYDLTGKDYQKSLSKTFLTDFLTKQIYPLGEIKESSFLNLDDKVNNYKLQFEKATLQLSITLDQESKIITFLFKLFTAEKPNKVAMVATSNPLQTPIEKEIDAAVRTYIQKPNTVGLSIGLIKDGKTSIYTYGETTKGNGRLPDANTIFEIGSITKTFTATLLAYFVNQHKIKLSDPITNYLPDSVAQNTVLKEVSIQMLSNHTSGLASLPDNFETKNYNPLNPYQHYTKNLLFTYLKNCKLNSNPGEVFAYSNMAVGLLGIILEKISGKTYEQLVKTIICNPLKMESTGQHLSPEENIRFAKVYNKQGDETPAWDLDALQSAGCLRSTVNDLLKYTKANMQVASNQLSNAFQLTHQVTFNQKPKVGLGWIIISVAGTAYYFHNGGMGGSSSYLAYNTDKKNAVIILSNDVDYVDPLGENLIKLLQ